MDFRLSIINGLLSFEVCLLDGAPLGSGGVDGSVVVFSTWIAMKDVRSSGASCMYLRTAELPHLPSSMIVTVLMPALASI